MQINLKQPEIIAALKQYIAAQGISLTGKKVIISFTAGRKDTGLSAEIDIEDTGMPDIIIDDEVEAKPTLVVVPHSSHDSPTPPALALDAAPVKTSSLFS